MNLSEALQKIFAGPTSRANQAGQAVLEYILVLVVTVSIILGILYQFNDAFKNFLDNYFGDYLACLLETGELPSLGGGGGPTTGECNAGFQNFSIASGRPNKEDSGKGSSERGNSKRGKNDGGRPGSQNSGGGSTNGEASGRNGGRNAALRPPRQRLSTNSSRPSQAQETTSSESGDFSSGRRRRILRRRKIRISGSFITRSDQKRAPKVIKAKKPKKERRLSALRSAKVPLTPPKPPSAPDIDVGGGFTFGKIVKFLIIIGIIVAIVVFLGGQIVQIRKSWQKGD
ncbi:MAG: hypothetical protein KDD33_01470 [Bdellovibrionales bacterium]|nr:hypothetical protein [Bdellovibrionales bacterium]